MGEGAGKKITRTNSGRWKNKGLILQIGGLTSLAHAAMAAGAHLHNVYLLAQDFSIVFVSAAPSTMLKLIFNTSFYKCSHLSMLVACGTWRLMASLRPMKASFVNRQPRSCLDQLSRLYGPLLLPEILAPIPRLLSCTYLSARPPHARVQPR